MTLNPWLDYYINDLYLQCDQKYWADYESILVSKTKLQSSITSSFILFGNYAYIPPIDNLNCCVLGLLPIYIYYWHHGYS